MTTVGPERVNKIPLNHGQLKHLTSIFIPSPKKGDVTKCTNNCTIALFPHTNKILLRISQKQLVSYIGHKMPMEQAGLSKGYGTRDQITNVSKSWTAQGSTTKMSICFLDYTKVFDSVQHLKMWNTTRSVGIYNYTNEEMKKRTSLITAPMANLTKVTKNLKFQPTQKLSYCRQQSFQQCSMGAQESR